MISGYQLFHNYIRPHASLDGKTPAEACGIKIKGKNKWMTIIQNAKQNITPKQYSITDYFDQKIKVPVSTTKDEMNLAVC